jgi:hypothetical protein
MQNTVRVENGLDFIKRKKAIKKRKKMVTKVVLSLMIFSLCIGVGAKLTKVIAHAGEVKVEKQLTNYEKVEVVINKGDTLWSLQEKLTPNADIREMLYLAEKNAGHNFTNVKAGDVVTLFKK